MSQTVAIDQLMRVSTVSRTLKREPSTVYRMIYIGELEAEKIDGALFVTRDSVERYLRQRDAANATLAAAAR